ncbi:tight adherence protein C [Microbacteriaceae bacterium SG_E_30_P1]|uniref:Tight adherence protein C n=1 Tax=Antiquaquibacter oligotrophicus TaxID=2880260 RepID=A0ABT6KKD3_9MICO|nr:type II secretion system F family protein [Antiquaquibacter oligotrophicus]MDH6180472.1 tight adherence protein C [Antiquaquibacter oligotrophicus]UDF13790.1 type II secretion system F family protein [Antiquaquibacter oligotrophicus]
MTSLQAWGVVTGIVFAIGAWCVLSFFPRWRPRRVLRRLAPYAADVSADARAMLRSAAPGAKGVLPLTRLFSRWGAVAGGDALIARLARQSGTGASLIRVRSQQAVAAVVGVCVGTATSLSIPGVSVPAASLLGAAGLAVGVLAPRAALARAASRRLARLDAELPSVLEFLALSLTAGEGILGAIRRIAVYGSGEMARELSIVVTDVAAGLTLARSLHMLARDLDLPAFTRCVDQLAAAAERGAPVTEVLRAQAQEARDAQYRKELEAAGRREIAMLFPLVFGVLPVTVLFAVFPGLVALRVGF